MLSDENKTTETKLLVNAISKIIQDKLIESHEVSVPQIMTALTLVTVSFSRATGLQLDSLITAIKHCYEGHVEEPTTH